MLQVTLPWSRISVNESKSAAFPQADATAPLPGVSAAASNADSASEQLLRAAPQSAQVLLATAGGAVTGTGSTLGVKPQLVDRELKALAVGATQLVICVSFASTALKAVHVGYELAASPAAVLHAGESQSALAVASMLDSVNTRCRRFMLLAGRIVDEI